MRKEEINHYNRWFTDRIQNYIKGLKGAIGLIFKPYIDFNKMGFLFGLYKNYIPNNRMNKNNQKTIANSTLTDMSSKFKKVIQKMIDNHPHLTQDLLIVQNDILNFINNYITIIQPKPTPDYQMYAHHPLFKRDYFKLVDTIEKAYWLGFLFADGYLTLEHKTSGDYYRMGMQLARKDKDVLIRLCNSIGLNPKYINDRLTKSAFSTKLYPMSEIRWGDQKFAQDLINLGMKYEYNQQKKRRVKIPQLPNLANRDLMLSFLLGFYDGDGTLGYDKKTRKIRPRIASSDISFLHNIKKYYRIKYKISSTSIEKMNNSTGKLVKISGSYISIEIKLFEELLRIYKNSLKRKRVSFDHFNQYKPYIE